MWSFVVASPSSGNCLCACCEIASLLFQSKVFFAFSTDQQKCHKFISTLILPWDTCYVLLTFFQHSLIFSAHHALFTSLLEPFITGSRKPLVTVQSDRRSIFLLLKKILPSQLQFQLSGAKPEFVDNPPAWIDLAPLELQRGFVASIFRRQKDPNRKIS